MTRRDLLRLTGSSLLYTGLAPLASLAGDVPSTGDRRLFFHPGDIDRIRANTQAPLLRELYTEWAGRPVPALTEAVAKYQATGEIIRDFMAAMRTLGQSAFVQLIEPTPERQAAILDAISAFIDAPHWDYFRDAENQVLGIQRASFATVRLLFAREVLGDAIDESLDKRLLKAVAEKGCLPCYRTIYDMEHPGTARGWDFDEQHAGFYDITMERWPLILGANNLRAAPTGALGLGALALAGHDPRADRWLKMAVDSTRRFLKLLTPDGSYFEGLSYLSYSLRTALPFMHAHRQLVGDVDWLSLVNWDGMLDYIMTMQLGKRDNGKPDIVNFSDANYSVFPGAISVIGDYTGNPLAGYATKEAGQPMWIYDFLWYKPDAPSKRPRPELLNMRNDLNWIICRSGWKPEDSVIAFKSGGPANHEHADRNHFIFKAYGERLLNDHFGASYDRRQPGWKMRFTRAHNAILIDGKSHPYIEGLEGTNDSKAYATILQYEDHGDHVWWTSDASAAYILDNYHVTQVHRTVIYAKPDVLVVFDQIRSRYRPQVVDARFFPDNKDGEARLAVDGERFRLLRPRASLHGLVVSDTGAAPRLSRLEVPEETGDFPCVEVHSPEGLTHRLVTVLAATPGAESRAPRMQVDKDGDSWIIEAKAFKARMVMKFHQPHIEIL